MLLRSTGLYTLIVSSFVAETLSIRTLNNTKVMRFVCSVFQFVAVCTLLVVYANGK